MQRLLQLATRLLAPSTMARPPERQCRQAKRRRLSPELQKRTVTVEPLPATEKLEQQLAMEKFASRLAFSPVHAGARFGRRSCARRGSTRQK